MSNHSVIWLELNCIQKKELKAPLSGVASVVGLWRCNVNGTSTFTSTVAGETYIINLKFNCDDKS